MTALLFAEHDNTGVPYCRHERFQVGEVVVRDRGVIEWIGTAFLDSQSIRPERSCVSPNLDHVIALDEKHLRRLIRDYVDY